MTENLENKIDIKGIGLSFRLFGILYVQAFFKGNDYAPMNYFWHMKIDRACQLLLHTNMKINQVALKLGFDDPYYFSRILSKDTVVSPKDYRHSLPK